MKFEQKTALYKLKELATILRSKDGCPWDQKQTHQSLKKYLIEETYEVIDAIESNDSEHLKEELGDLLYQIYAHSEISKDFSIDDVAYTTFEKLYSRHPHVFGDDSAEHADEVADKWERIKKKERVDKKTLEGVPAHLPALLKAYRVQEKVSRIGFDFPELSNTIVKLEEELEEFKKAVLKKNQQEMDDEFGDILFSIVNIARFSKIDPEESLRKAIDKFTARFNYIENIIDENNKSFDDFTNDELESMWQTAKKGT